MKVYLFPSKFKTSRLHRVYHGYIGDKGLFISLKKSKKNSLSKLNQRNHMQNIKSFASFYYPIHLYYPSVVTTEVTYNNSIERIKNVIFCPDF